MTGRRFESGQPQLHPWLWREGEVRIWRVGSVTGKGQTHLCQEVESSVWRRCNESASKELKNATPLRFPQAGGAGGCKALGTNERRKTGVGRLAVTEGNHIVGTRLSRPAVEERRKRTRCIGKGPVGAQVIKCSLNIHLYLQFFRTQRWWVDLSKHF